MKLFACALVTITLTICMLLGDMGYVPDPGDQRSWDIVGSVAIGMFFVAAWHDLGKKDDG